MEMEQDNIDSESKPDSKPETSSKLKLITVNNFLVSLRKQVVKARVHIIHKITR